MLRKKRIEVVGLGVGLRAGVGLRGCWLGLEAGVGPAPPPVHTATIHAY